MINSRSLDDLHPVVAAKARLFLAKCSAAGIDVLVTSTYRDNESQAALYAQGRTAPGKKVTNADAGQSMHNWRVALDVVPMRAGKPVWSTNGDDGALWRKVGSIGQQVGFEWGGAWAKFKDYPHFQYTGGLTLKDFQAGKTLPC